MKITIDLEASVPGCNHNNCPASFPVIGGPGGRVHIGKSLQELDPELYDELKSRIGAGEDAYWMPPGLE